jgi:predicted amidohydrolase YtcJ
VSRNSSRSFILIVLLAALAPGSGAQAARVSPPDLVLLGGRIFTANPKHPWAEALAIRGDRIVAVGRSADIRRMAGPVTRRVHLGGRVVIPGFNDAHDHLGAPLPGIAFATSNEPVPDPSLGQVLDSLSSIVRRVPPGTWVRASIDAVMLDDSRARRDALDSVAPHNPVWLGANTGHGAIVNTAALHALEIGDSAADPIGGFYERTGVPYPGRGSGRLTGLLHEYAAWNAAATLRSSQPDSLLIAALQRHAAQALKWGITSIQDMANAFDPVTTFRVLRSARLPVRIRVIAMPATGGSRRRTAEWTAARAAPEWRDESHAGITATKWILDGTGIERLSLLRAPYADRAPWAGEVNFAPDTLRAILRESLASRAQPVLHTVGDSTIALVLSLMHSLAPDSAWRRLRPRLEHAEWLTADLRRRARQLGVVVIENPSHFTDGDERMRARFGALRSPQYQPFRSITDAGIPLGIGSDGELNPFVNLMFAVTHPDNPREALTMAAAVTAYTHGSAYAEFSDREKGVLAPGMLADLAVLSQDIFSVPVDSLPGTQSVLTIVGGAIAYDAGVLGASASTRLRKDQGERDVARAHERTGDRRGEPRARCARGILRARDDGARERHLRARHRIVTGVRGYRG